MIAEKFCWWDGARFKCCHVTYYCTVLYTDSHSNNRIHFQFYQSTILLIDPTEEPTLEPTVPGTVLDEPIEPTDDAYTHGYYGKGKGYGYGKGYGGKGKGKEKVRVA